ncbi:MAG TPA: ComEC/Rec2 family competence protein [Kofleriaceae bacterium]
MSRTPGPLPLAIALAIGIGLAPHVGGAGWWPIAVAVAIASVKAARKKSGLVAVAALVAALAAGLGRGVIEPAPVPAGATTDDRTLDRIVGVVTGPPTRTARGLGARLEVSGTGAQTVWIWAAEPVRAGETIAVTGRLTTPRSARGPAQTDRADLVRARGADYELTAQHVERIADEPGLVDHAWRWADGVQQGWSRTIDRAGGAPDARAALRGIVAGDRTAVPPDLDARWRAAGIYHVLSVSGLHLAVVAGLVFALIRRLVAASPWGGRVHPARWAAPPALAVAIAYTLVTGAQLATLRALIAIALVFCAAMLDRPVRLIDALGVAALAILVWRPADLFDPGFQLSFVAALALALVPASPRRGVRGYLVRGITATFWVTLATAPITAYHFQQVTPGGLVGNLVLTPIIELVALPLALGGLAVGWDAPVAAATWLVELTDGIAGVVAVAMPVGQIALVGTIVLASCVALSIVLAMRAARTRLDAVLWLALCLAWSQARTPAPAGALRVTFVDVGQGDAAVIELPDGAVWLVDAGGIPGVGDGGSAPGQAIARVLAAYGRDRIDVAIVSHPHPDHYLGLAALAVPIGELWVAPEDDEEHEHGGAFRELAARLVARGTRIVHPPLGEARVQAGVTLVTWAPRYRATDAGPPRLAADPVRSVNDNSLVVELRYRGRAILFTGDLELEGESELVAAGIESVDVVKVPHHGSRTSSGAALALATRPAHAVISCGRANQFGFPDPEVVARWASVGAEVARTDRDGAVIVTVDETGDLTVKRFVSAGP